MKTVFVTQETLTEINTKTYMIWVYMDQAEKLVTDLARITQENNVDKQLIKQRLNTMKKTALQFRESLNMHLKDQPDKIEAFGEASDLVEIQMKTDLYNALKKELEIN